MNPIDRRKLLKLSGLGMVGAGASGFLPALARQAAAEEAATTNPRDRRHCILLWMTGGPSQIDTFDLKPDHDNGGEFKETATSVPGLRISEHLPKLAKMADRLAIVRSLSTKEGDHGRGTYVMRTGHTPMGQTRYPTIGASLSKHLGGEDDAMPSYVSVSPYRVFNQAAFGPGFLGPKYAPLTVGATDVYQQQPQNDDDSFAELRVDDFAPPGDVSAPRLDERLDLLRTLQEDFVNARRASAPIAQKTVYERAVRLMHSDGAKAFDLTQETDEVRRAYGPGRFGQGCLMARRLVERGVSFVEVNLGSFGGGSLGWDTHTNNFNAVRDLSAELDAGWSMLMKELAERGLLERTTILWMGEFGRTPRINGAGGRDHFPAAWTCVFAGGGINGGQAFGRTSKDGMTVEEDQVGVGDVLATLCKAVGVSHVKQNISEQGRPIALAEGSPIRKILA